MCTVTTYDETRSQRAFLSSSAPSAILVRSSRFHNEFCIGSEVGIADGPPALMDFHCTKRFELGVQEAFEVGLIDQLA